MPKYQSYIKWSTDLLRSKRDLAHFSGGFYWWWVGFVDVQSTDQVLHCKLNLITSVLWGFLFTCWKVRVSETGRGCFQTIDYTSEQNYRFFLVVCLVAQSTQECGERCHIVVSTGVRHCLRGLFTFNGLSWVPSTEQLMPSHRHGNVMKSLFWPLLLQILSDSFRLPISLIETLTFHAKMLL